MKKSSGKCKPPPLLSVIEAARAGKADAMEQILQHYDAYINKLCLRTMVDESGQTHKQVDAGHYEEIAKPGNAVQGSK